MMLQRLSTAKALFAVICGALSITLVASPVLAARDLLEIGSLQQRGDPILKLTLGKAEVITIPGSVSDILVANPKIADVVALQTDKLYIVGASLGDTNIIATDQTGNVLKRFNISVNVDTDAIEDMVRHLFPDERDVKVHMIGDQLALTGLVSTPSVAQKIARLVAAHMGEIQGKDFKSTNEAIENLLEVRGEQQVMLRVRMVEMSRSVLKELGLETSANQTTLTGNPLPHTGNGLQGFLGVTGRTGLTKDPLGVGALVWNSTIGGLGQLEFLINALENDNLANILAEPNLTSVSGEQAGFLAGGEFPVPVGRDRDGNIMIEYKEFGVSLNFRPIVLSEDRISLQLNTEVSSLNQSQGITLADIQVPGLDIRRASTTVEINSGGTLMMAGLLKSDSIKGLSGLPGIKDTPVIGDLLSSDSFSRQETELVLLVTPYLVQPFADKNQAVPVMNESEFGDLLPPPPPAGLMAPGKERKGRLEGLPNVDDDVPPAPIKKSDAAPARIAPVSAEEMVAQSLAPRKSLSPNSPLSKAFSKNLNQAYGNKVGDMSKEKQSYGYMLE